MAPGVITTTKSLPPSAQLTAARLALLGFREGQWAYRMNTDLADPAKRMQVRDIATRAPLKEVAHYAEMMKPYTTRRDQLDMPPVVMTRDGYLLDGNTRTEAARKLGWMTFPAIVLNDSYENAPGALRDQFITVGARLNLTHGRGLSPANVEKLILLITKDGDAPADVAKKLQVSRSTVTMVLTADKARQRAARLRIPLSPALTRSHLAALGSSDDKLTDPVFTALLGLVQDTRMSHSEMKSVVRKVNGCSTEQQKLELIENERGSRHGQVTQGLRKPPLSAQLRQRLGFIANHEPGDLVELSPGSAQSHAEQLEDAIKKLREVLNEQYALNRNRG